MSYMQCRICDKQLFYTHSDTSQLVDHFSSEHAEVKVVGFGRSNGNLRESPSDRDVLTKNSSDWTVNLLQSPQGHRDRDVLTKNSSDWTVNLLQNPQGHRVGFQGGVACDDSVRQTQSSRSRREPRWNSPARSSTASEGMVRGENDRRLQRPRNGGQRKGHVPCHHVDHRQPPRMKNKEQVFRTTVESWGHRKGKITCSSCGHTNTPIVRRHDNVATNSAFGRCFLLVCWPLMFLPWSLLKSESVNLYCPVCNHYLGTQEKNGAIQRPPTPMDVQRTMRDE